MKYIIAFFLCLGTAFSQSQNDVMNYAAQQQIAIAIENAVQQQIAEQRARDAILQQQIQQQEFLRRTLQQNDPVRIQGVQPLFIVP